MKLYYTPRAMRDLKRLREFIAKKNPLAAQKASRQLKRQIKALKTHPEMGINHPFLRGVQDLVAREYTVRYRVVGDIVQVLMIWHEKEDI
jgi:toxin ParE1/3/4